MIFGMDALDLLVKAVNSDDPCDIVSLLNDAAPLIATSPLKISVSRWKNARWTLFTSWTPYLQCEPVICTYCKVTIGDRSRVFEVPVDNQ